MLFSGLPSDLMFTFSSLWALAELCWPPPPSPGRTSGDRLSLRTSPWQDFRCHDRCNFTHGNCSVWTEICDAFVCVCVCVCVCVYVCPLLWLPPLVQSPSQPLHLALPPSANRKEVGGLTSHWLGSHSDPRHRWRGVTIFDLTWFYLDKVSKSEYLSSWVLLSGRVIFWIMSTFTI